MILETIGKACLIMMYLLIISVISIGICGIGLAIMSTTESTIAHWIIAIGGASNIGIILWTMQDVIEGIVEL